MKGIKMKKSEMNSVSVFASRQTRWELVIAFTLAQMGSKEALEIFLRGCLTILLKWTWKSDDAASNAWSYLARHWQDYDPAKSELSTFLRCCAAAGWRSLKRANQDKEVLFSMLDTDKEEYIEQIASLDNYVQMQEELQAVVEYLPEGQMELLASVFYDGKTFDEVAKEQGCSKVTVRNNVLRIVNSCREHFGTKGRVKGLTRHNVKFH